MRYFQSHLKCSFSSLFIRDRLKGQNSYRHGLNFTKNLWVSTGRPRSQKSGLISKTLRPTTVCKFSKRDLFTVACNLSDTTHQSTNQTMAEDLSRAMQTMKTNDNSRLETLNFDNIALKMLPYDDSTDPRVRRQVPRACFTSAQPTPVENPETVVCSPSALALLDVSESDSETESFADYFSGNRILPGSTPSAHCYCGHQFGYFSGQLGDGAAMLV